MEIVLQNSLILIRTDFHTLNQEWMREFLTNHSKNMLFLPKAVLIFKDQSLAQSRNRFLEKLSRHYAKRYDLREHFFKKSLLKLKKQPIKIELISMQEVQSVTVELYARDKYTVDISLYYPNSWVMSYLKSQLDIYIKGYTDSSIILDVSHMKAKSRLERALNKRHILHYQIQYRYDSNFMQRLYSDFSMFEFEEHEDERIEKMIHFYTVLECPDPG